jgi:hypothetical protein
MYLCRYYVFLLVSLFVVVIVCVHVDIVPNLLLLINLIFIELVAVVECA